MVEKVKEPQITKDQMVDLMSERRSIRVFDPNQVISEDILHKILETMRLAPSSYGLFNVRLLVLPRSPWRNQLNHIFYDQKNFITSSHYIIFVVDSGEQIRNHTVFETATGIFGPRDSLEKKNYIENFLNVYESKYWNQEEKANAWSTRQAYIVGGVATVTAGYYGIGTCMMEGFDNIKLQDFLRTHGLITNQEIPVLGMALGYGDPTYKFRPKARLSFDQYVTNIS